MTGGGVQKLRLCPFCGCEQLTTRHHKGLAFVQCDQCEGQGPVAWDMNMGAGFDYMPVEDQEAALIDRARELWNMRPPCGNYYPEDLEEPKRNWMQAAFDIIDQEENTWTE